MRCLHVNIRTATVIILCIVVNHINIIQMVDSNAKSEDSKIPKDEASTMTDNSLCFLEPKCENLHPECLDCDFKNNSCVYGELITRPCNIIRGTKCEGSRNIQKQFVCRYCYQTEAWEHTCDLRANCNSVASPRIHYTTNCTVKRDILCLGNRTFNKNVMCNWTGGYRWTTALILSITLGGFGADRFYLGHWQEGIGKLFSFGGLGVWTIIDVILISLHYLGPADGSLYI